MTWSQHQSVTTEGDKANKSKTSVFATLWYKRRIRQRRIAGPKLPASLSISLVSVLGQPDAKVSGIPAGLAGRRSAKRPTHMKLRLIPGHPHA